MNLSAGDFTNGNLKLKFGYDIIRAARNIAYKIRNPDENKAYAVKKFVRKSLVDL